MTDVLDYCEYTFICPLANGIHARPANTLERLVSGFSSQVSIENLSNRRVANAKSVLSLVGADIKSGDSCLLRVGGPDRHAAYRRIVRFLKTEFAACDAALPAVPHVSEGAWLPPVLRRAGVEMCFGTPAVAGLGRGVIVCAEGLHLPEAIAGQGAVDPDEEWVKFDNAVSRQRRRIARQLDSGQLSATEAGILEAHRSIVQDVELTERVREAIIQRRIGAGPAIMEAFEYFSRTLKTAQSALIRERIADLQDVCSQLIEALYGTAAEPALTLTKPSIVVAENLTPSQFMAMDKTLLSGLVLYNGGTTSHTVILARSFGIPVLTGLSGTVCHVMESSEAIVDTEYGVLICRINEPVERFYTSQRRKQLFTQNQTAAFRDKPAMTRDGVRLAVMANVASAQEVAAAIDNGADGIGLFRTEMLFMGRDSAPGEAEQFAVYKTAAELAGGRPVVIRTFDIGGDKAVDYLSAAAEDNPFLGYRGVRLYREFEQIFRTQLRAIVRASAFGSLKIMIPMVSCIEQVTYVRDILEQVKAELAQTGTAFDASIPLGIMVEVPLAAFLIAQMAQAVDFVSIGTNDLAQYFLAVDRSNTRVAALYQCRHPGFLSLIRKIADDAHRCDLPVGMCGEMAAQRDNLGLLLGAGLDSVSVAATCVPQLKSACLDYDSAECRAMLDEAVLCGRAEQVDALQVERLTQAAGRSILDVNLIDLNCDCDSKEEAIKAVCDMLFLDQRSDNPVVLEKDFWHREEVYSTGLGHGISVPHCKSGHIRSHSICVLRLRRPVEWGSIDGSPVSVVIAMAIGEAHNAGKTHLRYFSRLSRSIMHDTFRQTIRAASSASEIVSLLSERLGLEYA